MKACIGCRETKPLDQYNKKGKGLNAKCKGCLSEYYKRAYRDNPNRRSQIVRAGKVRRKKLAEFVDTLKICPCVDCGKQDPPYAMDFDHRDPTTKVCAIALAVGSGSWSKERILTEIAKCDLVCAGCHRKRTHARKISDRSSAVEHSLDKR